MSYVSINNKRNKCKLHAIQVNPTRYGQWRTFLNASCVSDAEKDCKVFGFFCLFVRLVGCLVVFLISLNSFQSTQDAWGACYSKTDYVTQLL